MCVQRMSAAAAGAAAVEPTHTSTVLDVVSKFQQCSDPKQRYQLVLSYADSLPAYPEELKQPENRVLGCSAQVRACQKSISMPTFAHAGHACMHGLSLLGTGGAGRQTQRCLAWTALP
jgi:hypothetical protein